MYSVGRKKNTGSEQCGALEQLKLALTNKFVESIGSWMDWYKDFTPVTTVGNSVSCKTMLLEC